MPVSAACFVGLLQPLTKQAIQHLEHSARSFHTHAPFLDSHRASRADEEGEISSGTDVLPAIILCPR